MFRSKNLSIFNLLYLIEKGEKKGTQRKRIIKRKRETQREFKEFTYLLIFLLRSSQFTFEKKNKKKKGVDLIERTFALGYIKTRKKY